MKDMILYVDCQNDFFEGGALAVAGSLGIIPALNEIHKWAKNRNALEVFSQDMHPEKTKHFDKWPSHCVEKTHGCEIHTGLTFRSQTDMEAYYCLKGRSTEDDGYSAFDGQVNYEGESYSLVDFMNNMGVENLYVCGLATDYCVVETVLSARMEYIKTFVFLDAIAAVNVEPRDGDKALARMIEARAELITMESIR